MRRFVAAVAAVAAVFVTGGAAVAQPDEVATCGSADLDIGFGRVGGAAGTVYREVVFTNRGLHTCVLRGFPGVSYVDAEGDQVGAAAARVGERGALLTLPHGGTATSDVGFAQVDNFDPDVCLKTPVWGIRVFPPDETVPLYLSLLDQPMDDQYGCAGDVSPFGNQLTAASVRS
ncbi:DUF4232 domain-containing protein [Saccharothrix deserti]|uniref:DUF4232 domain-containing protein n=1 Tax=Saccharothrix deserti TaxID=2593674 RepID=UPI00131A6C45|nr:DUF4232 domain-containing protein [Saccharothrix deserti]